MSGSKKRTMNIKLRTIDINDYNRSGSIQNIVHCLEDNFISKGYTPDEAVYLMGKHIEGEGEFETSTVDNCLNTVGRMTSEDEYGNVSPLGYQGAKDKFNEYFKNEYELVKRNVNITRLREKVKGGGKSSGGSIGPSFGGSSSFLDQMRKKDKELSSQEKVQIKDFCEKSVAELDFYKKPFLQWILAAQRNVMKNHQLQIFFETCNLITNTKSNVHKGSLLLNLFMFIYADKNSIVKKSYIENAGNMKNILFLTIVTHKSLLQGKSTQKDTFQEIWGYTGSSKASFEYLSIKSKLSKCKKVKDGKSTVTECDQKQWAEIYGLFTEKQMIDAIVKIINPSN